MGREYCIEIIYIYIERDIEPDIERQTDTTETEKANMTD